MDDFEMYQKGESLDDPEVINRRQDVHSAWSKLQLLVEEREALIRKAISYHKTMFEVNQVLDGLESEWTKAMGYYIFDLLKNVFSGLHRVASFAITS